jgi:mannitol/fructose-specific phosphotransferase system IIA component (Ntr-type)
MKAQFETLRRIQELSLTRGECEARGDAEHAGKLSAEIRELEAALEQRVRALYERVRASKPLFAVTMHNGNCSGCGMQVPVTAARFVRSADRLVTCSACGRILCGNSGAVSSARSAEIRSEEVSDVRGIARFSAESLMIPRLAAETPQAAIEELSKAMADNGFVTDAGELTKLALEREALLSTYMEEGVAVPHVRGVEGGSLAFALGISEKGIVWDDSGAKAHFVVLSAIPSAGSVFFLRLMSDLMSVFRRKAGRESLFSTTSKTALWNALDKATCRVIR